MRSLTLAAISLVLISLAAGCSRLRFVIDAVPAEDDLTETEVLKDPGSGGGSKIVLIDVSGVIMDANKPAFPVPRENPVARLTEALDRAAEDSSVRAIVLRINSPGGTVTASDVMYREVMHFKRETGKPVVVLMADVAASGGYYLACAGDELIAHPTTVTGSIGVIIQTVNFAAGLGKIGIKAESITSGPNKAMGSPLEPMPQEHRELLQGLVNEFYANFKAVVIANRPQIQDKDLSWVTDGRVVTGQRAVEVGLVDRTGDLRDAFAAAKVRAGVTSATLVKYHRPLEHVASAYALADQAGQADRTQLNVMQINVDRSQVDQPGFYYLWDPAVW